MCMYIFRHTHIICTFIQKTIAFNMQLYNYILPLQCAKHLNSLKQGEIKGNTIYLREMFVCAYCVLCCNVAVQDAAAMYKQIMVGMPFQEIYICVAIPSLYTT